MKTISTALKNYLKSQEVRAYQKVSYKRRYWSQATSKYVWESSWTEIAQADVETLTPINGKLDTEKLNEFKVSNITLILKNADNRWSDRNPSGKFKGDAASPPGYEPYWTKFQIKFGYVLPDDSTEEIVVFTGLATEFDPDPIGLTIRIRVDGLESLLTNANAENVSTRVVNENLGTGNGSNKDFTTAQPGVGIIEDVSSDGATKQAGVDYTISQLNEKTLGAKISYQTAPGVGVVVRCTYRYWKQNQKIENLVKDLLTEAGIATADQVVDSVLFPSTVNNTHVATNQADFLAGANTTLDVTTFPDSMRIDFDDASQDQLLDDMSDVSDWTVLVGSVSSVAGKMRLDDGSCKRSASKVVGVWETKYQFSALGSVSRFGFHFMAQDIIYSPFSTRPSYGYSVMIVDESFPGASNNLQLWRWGASGDGGLPIGQASGGKDTNPHTIRVSRTPQGRIRVYLDGTLKIDVTDNTWTSTAVIGFEGETISGFGVVDVDYVNVPKDTLAAEHVSPVIDTLVAPVAWGRLVRTHATNGGTITYYTRSSATNPPTGSWDAVSENTQVNSGLLRYAQVRVVFTAATTANNDPIVHDYSLEYKNTAVNVALANFTGKNCFTAIQDLGRFANYEWGFKADETFFFRGKTPTTDVDEVLDYRWNVASVESLGTGFERVYSEVQATYGDYDVTLKDDGLSRTGPGARFARRRLVVEGGDTLVSANADVASGMASVFLNYYRRPRRRFRVRCKLLPHVDNGDTVTLTYLDGLPNRPWHLGDLSVYHGNYDIHHFGSGSMIADGLLSKVLAFRHDKKNEMSEFEIEEILQ